MMAMALELELAMALELSMAMAMAMAISHTPDPAQDKQDKDVQTRRSKYAVHIPDQLPQAAVMCARHLLDNGAPVPNFQQYVC